MTCNGHTQVSDKSHVTLCRELAEVEGASKSVEDWLQLAVLYAASISYIWSDLIKLMPKWTYYTLFANEVRQVILADGKSWYIRQTLWPTVLNSTWSPQCTRALYSTRKSCVRGYICGGLLYTIVDTLGSTFYQATSLHAVTQFL